MKRITGLLLGLFLALNSAVTGAELTNADIIKMLAAGLREPVVIQAIDSAEPAKFDTSADGLIALKKAGASDAVVQKVISRQAGQSHPNTPSQLTESGSDCKIEAPNIGALVMRAGGRLLPMTYQTAKVDTKAGGFLGSAFSYGIAKVKVKTMLRIDKAQASFRIPDRQPQLLDLLSPLGSSPDNLYVVRLTVRDNARYLQIGSSEANAVGNSSSVLVIPDGIRVNMNADTLSTRCTWKGKEYSHYRIKPAEPLENGEYALLDGLKMFDFGVDSPQ